MRTLEVWLGNNLVGYINETRKGGRFSYLPEIVEQKPSVPLLSLCFPVKSKPFGEAKTANWFEGLLPEGPRRTEICRNLGIGEYDWIGLLAEIGWECAGAVRIFDRDAPKKNHQNGYQKIDLSTLAVQLTHISERMPRRDMDIFRMSLGGFQEKMCVAMPSLRDIGACESFEEVFLPLGDEPSTHILKPENVRDYPGSAESEAWAMTVCKHAARCSNVALLKMDDAPDTLIVERFDRLTQKWPDEVLRSHQEDVCQALGLAPEGKYATQATIKGNDPTYKGAAELLRRYSSHPETELAELLRQIVANVIMGNWDAHAKNIAFLYKKEADPVIAPMYDVLPIVDIEKRTTVLSLRIAGSLNPSDVSKVSLIEEASSWGMMHDEASYIIDECIQGIQNGLGEAQKLYPQAAHRHEAGVCERIKALRT